MIKNFGFLSMEFESEEKRDFRPSFFAGLKNLKQDILLDYDYGKKLGYSNKDYLDTGCSIRFVDRKEVLNADCVFSVRTPGLEELKYMKEGAIIVSMLHYITHEKRNRYLEQKGVKMIALDSVTDDFGTRMIQDFSGTVKNAFEAAYQDFFLEYKSRNPVNVLVLGTGEIGKIAVDTAVNQTNRPIIVTAIGISVTSNREYLSELIKKTDILVDATKRQNTSKIIVSNEMVGLLPEHAFIIDLSADDYDTSIGPIQVKGIEGIPTGNLGQFVFRPDDPIYDKIPKEVSTKNRRVVISCYSWPGVNPIACLDRYEIQIEPFIRTLSTIDYDSFQELSNDLYERALYRATYSSFLESLKK
jgi:alanine dehydrogenase